MHVMLSALLREKANSASLLAASFGSSSVLASEIASFIELKPLTQVSHLIFFKVET